MLERMAKPGNLVFRHLVLSFLLLQFLACSELACCLNVIKSLPGYDGPLPFELETGYVGVGDAEEIQLFYYFIKSETNPAEDPLLIWFSGGPGCSSFFALVYEIGPLNFQVVEYNGSLPSLVLNPYPWTKHSSIIFLDLPIGAGFSYSRSQDKSGQSGDLVSSYQAQLFLRKWLVDHPEFQSNPVYVGGDSHSGLTVPIVALDISNGNDNGFEPFINLKGYILGNPITRLEFEGNFKIPFAYGMGLISDELYESLQRNCKGEYAKVDSSNSACLNAVQAYDNCTYHINDFHTLEPDCPRDSPSPFHSRRPPSSDEFLRLHSDDPDIPIYCRTYRYLLSSYWANDEKVQKAIQVRKGTMTEKWKRCNYGLPYDADVDDSFSYHVNLSSKGYRSLIYSGDHDFLVTFLGTQAWIRDLNYAIIDDWRPWIVEGEIAGYTRTYSNNMTFATVKGAGHTAPGRQSSCQPYLVIKTASVESGNAPGRQSSCQPYLDQWCLMYSFLYVTFELIFGYQTRNKRVTRTKMLLTFEFVVCTTEFVGIK